MRDKLRVFVSSRMEELAEERQLVKHVLRDLNINAWVYEDHAGSRPGSIEDTFLDEVKEADVYLGLFWLGYGGYTIEEYDYARKLDKPCFIYQKQVDENDRDKQLKDFLKQVADVEKGITPGWFKSLDDLSKMVRDDISEWSARFIRRRLASQSEAKLYETREDINENPDKLIGREQILEKVSGYLEDGLHVSLTGFGGTGKTALAAQFTVARIEAGQGPVVWLRVDEADENHIFESIAMCLDAVEKLTHAGRDSQSGVIKKLLAEKHIGMVVLDDVRQPEVVPKVRAAIPEGVPLLLTSRYDILFIDESVKVAELEPQKALQLLAFHAQNEVYSEAYYLSDKNSEKLCQKLAYHTLAIVIAGIWLKRGDEPPAELLERIEERDVASSTIDMERSYFEEGHHNVKFVLDDMLFEIRGGVRDIFDAYGRLFIPKATPNFLVECVDGLNKFDVKNALRELKSWNIVMREDGGAFRMHDMIYQYAEMRNFGFEKPDRSATVEVVQRFVTKYAQDYVQLGLDLANILEAGKAAGKSGDTESLIEIVRLLVMDGYIDYRGHTSDLVKLLDDTIAVIKQDGEAELELLHHLLCKRGNVYINQGNLEKGYQLYKEASDIAPNPARKAILLSGLGRVRATQELYAEAEDYFKQATALAQSEGDLETLSRVLEQQCFVAFIKEDFEDVREIAKRGIDLSIQVDDRIGEGSFRVNLGSAEYELGVRKALVQYKEALQIARSEQDSTLEADALHNLGLAYHAQEDYQRATEHLEQAHTLFDQLGFTSSKAKIETFMRQCGYVKEN